jgi:hypothetical protein
MKSFKRAIYKVNNYFEDVQQISCNSSLNTEGESGIYEVEVNLGTDSGEVTINHEAFNIPDRFQVFKEDGSLLADSKFVGDKVDNYKTQLLGTHTLTVYKYNDGVFEDSGITENVTITSNDIADGSVNEPKAGYGKIRFQKNENKNWVVKIRVTGVIGTTIWNLSASCPTNTTTSSPYNPSNNVKMYPVMYHGTIADFACDEVYAGELKNFYSKTLLQVGTQFYKDSQLLNKAPSGYIFVNKTIYKLNTGKVIDSFPCYKGGI